MNMVMTLDETQIQIAADWPMSKAKRTTKDNRKNPLRISRSCRDKETETKTCLAEKSWPNHVTNEQHIGSKKND